MKKKGISSSSLTRFSKELEKERFSTAGQLAREIIHELNNPLSVITSTAQYLSDKLSGRGLSKISKADFTECLESLEKITDEGMRCGAITSWFIRLTSQEESKIELIDINKTIEELVSMVTHPFSLEKVDITAKLNPHLPKVRGDREQLKQVFMSMILRAQQSMPNGGRLTVKTSSDRKNDRIEIGFTDTGIKGEKATPRDLGLSYRIIKAHKGTVDLESKRGRGSTFIIKLPIEIEGAK